MTLKVTGGAATLDELLGCAVTTTVIVELDMTVTDVISLKANDVDELDEATWFGASVKTPMFPELDRELLLLELAPVLVALNVLRLLELDGLAVEVVKLLRNVVERNTPVVYVYDILILAFDRHDAGIVKQHGSPVEEEAVDASTPE